MPTKSRQSKSPEVSYVAEARRAKVFRTGGSVAVRIPKDFYLEDDDLMITKVTDGILLSPVPKVLSVTKWWATWDADPTLMADGRQQPAMQVRDFEN